AAHEAATQGLTHRYEENRRWLKTGTGERAARLGELRDTMGNIIAPEGMKRLNSLADEQPGLEELMETSDRLDAYIQAYAKAKADLRTALAGLPHKKEAAGLMTRLTALNGLTRARDLAEALPDPNTVTDRIREVRTILAGPEIIAAVDALPQPDREGLMDLINERDQQISAALTDLSEAITDGTAKSDLINSFSPLKNLAALGELNPLLDRLPPGGALSDQIQEFPDTSPVLSASALLAMIPEQETWKESIRTGISPETLERVVEDISRHIDDDPLSAVAVDQRFTPPASNKLAMPELLAHVTAAGKRLDETVTILDATAKTDDPALMAGETAGDLKSLRQAFTELGKSNRSFLVVLMAGFLLLMVICFIYVMTRSPRGASAGETEAEDASCPGFILEFTSQSKRLEKNLSHLPEIMADIKDQGSESHTRANKIFDDASIVHNNIERVSRFMSQASTNLNTISTAAGGITDSIGEIARNSENAREVTQRAVTEARSTTQKVSELGKAATAIDNVTHAINEISEQTKLLGLNATIEAARAGEAGKGFAVVATEIQALARQTAEATEDIRDKVGHINAVSDEMIQQIELISDTIHNGNEMVTSIAQAVDTQSDSTREIAENVGEASEGISEVSGKVSANLEFVSGILDSIKGVADRSEALVRSAEEATDFSRNQAEAAANLTENLKNHEG
ncbi:MAG: methyl-accepting chemotaxis protein, partial [Desulfobacterales bacterium]|nr:methyl-accepting chemotaxis protein [Desulfobacterales bacterium]